VKNRWHSSLKREAQALSDGDCACPVTKRSWHPACQQLQLPRLARSQSDLSALLPAGQVRGDPVTRLQAPEGELIVVRDLEPVCRSRRGRAAVLRPGARRRARARRSPQRACSRAWAVLAAARPFWRPRAAQAR